MEQKKKQGKGGAPLPCSSCSSTEPLQANSSVEWGQERAWISVCGTCTSINLVKEVRTLESLQEFLRVIFGGDSREGRDGLAAVALLDTDVDVVG